MTEPATTRDFLSFGPFQLVPSERLLTRDGVELELGGRAMDLLLRLVVRPNEPVGKQELLAKVWPDVTVGETSLRFAVAQLRKALGDGIDGARYITTMSGRGYCFVAPISRARQPVASASFLNTNLPMRPALIGREDELSDVAGLLGQERLLTIVGPGGVGKTRLAIASGWRSVEAYPDGVWLIDLAPLTEPSLVVSALATTLDLARGATELSAALMALALRDRRLLLIFDNCEHLVGAAAELAEALLQGAPGLTILATSQESLRLDNERVYRLDPLPVPPPDAVEVEGYGAVLLFTLRAHAADHRFAMGKTSTAAVADICRRLDGLPLSLEMAAARVSSLGLDGLRTNLEARLHMLSRGMRTSDIRHQTLRSTVAWSVGLLDETEQRVFRRLGVFCGGFSLETAMAVVAAGEMERWIVADTLARLVDKSLVSLERTEPARYRQLETLRLYARELLETSGEWDRLAASHARHFRDLFAPSRHAWETTPYAEWQSAYLPELDNLRAAVDWALAVPARADLVIELTASAGYLWYEWGLVEEGRRYLARAVALVDDRTPPALAAAILQHAGALLSPFDIGAAQTQLERSAAIFRELGDETSLAGVKLTIAQLYVRRARPSEAEAAMRGVHEVLSASGHKRSLCLAMNTLGTIAINRQNAEEAIEYFQSLAELASQLRDASLGQLAVTNWAVSEFSRGDVGRAIELGREAVVRSRGLLQNNRLPQALHNLAAYLLAQDRLGEARPVAEEGLSILRRRAGFDLLLANMQLQMWALIAALEGKYPEAARLIGWVDAAYVQGGLRRNPWEQRSYQRFLALLSPRLSERELSAYAAEGANWDMAQAANFTFDRIVPAPG